MSSPEAVKAARLLNEIESRWVSLLLWLSRELNLSPRDVVEKLGDPGLEAINNYERAKVRHPAATFTPLHFLQFPDYVTVAAIFQRELAALGTPRPDG